MLQVLHTLRSKIVLECSSIMQVYKEESIYVDSVLVWGYLLVYILLF